MKEKNKIILVLVIAMSVVTFCTLTGFALLRLGYYEAPIFESITGNIASASDRIFHPEYFAPTQYTGTTSTSISTSSTPALVESSLPGVQKYIKYRNCTKDELFSENIKRSIEAKDRTYLSNIISFGDDYVYPVAVMFWFQPESSYESIFLVNSSEECKYELDLKKIDVMSLRSAYYSVDEKRVYFLENIYSETTGKLKSTIQLIKFDPINQVVDKTTELILPFPNGTFGFNDYINQEAREKLIFLEGTMLDVTNAKLYLSTVYFNGCFSDFKCRFDDPDKDYASEENQRVTGVYQIDLNTKEMKKVHNPPLLNSEGVLLKTNIEKLSKFNSVTNEYTFEIYYKDTREKITKP